MFSEIISIPGGVIFAVQLILGVAMLLCVYRIIKGPTLMDRIVGLDLLAALIMAQIVTLVLVTGFLSFLNVAVAIAVISFIATVALARYLEQTEDSE